MKKVLIVLTIVALVTASLASFALAAEKNETPQWFKDMISWKKEQIDQALEDGEISKEQAEAWKDHMDDMEKWHTENGFNYGNMGFGACHGGFGKGPGFRGGFGPGMMRWQSQ